MVLKTCSHIWLVSQFNRNGRCFTTTDAQGGNSTLLTHLLQGVDEGDNDSGTSRTDGMTLRARTAVNVDAFWIQIEILDRRHGHHGECFVDLEEVYIGFVPAGLGQ